MKHLAFIALALALVLPAGAATLSTNEQTSRVEWLAGSNALQTAISGAGTAEAITAATNGLQVAAQIAAATNGLNVAASITAATNGLQVSTQIAAAITALQTALHGNISNAVGNLTNVNVWAGLRLPHLAPGYVPVLDANSRLTNSSLSAAAAELLNSSDQFLGAKIRAEATTTNLSLYGATLQNGTASKVVILNSSKGLITSDLDAAALTNLADVLGPLGAALDLKASLTALYGETNALWLRAKGPWTVLTDPTTIDLSIPRQRIILNSDFAPNLINTNNGESCVLSIECATPHTITLPVNFPEGAPSTNNWSGTNRFYIEVVGASKRVDCYFSAGLIAGVINSSFGKGTNTMLWGANLRSSTNNLTALDGRLTFEGAMGDTNHIYSSDEGIPIILNRLGQSYTNMAPTGAQLFGWNTASHWFARRAHETAASNSFYYGSNIVISLIGTNNGAFTNISLSADYPRQEVWLTNNVSITNWSGITAGTAKDLRIHFLPQLVPRTITYPVFSAPALGMYWRTNVNSPMYTTFTNGVAHVLSISTRGTNVFVSLTLW